MLCSSASPCTVLWGQELPGRGTLVPLGVLRTQWRPVGEAGAWSSLAKSEHLRVLASANGWGT